MTDAKTFRLEAIEAKRAARKAAERAKADEQRAIDLEYVDALEVEHGDDNIAVVHLPFTQGLPTLAVARCPKPAEMKRYRSRVTPKKDGRNVAKDPDYAAAAEELAATCRIYPAPDVYEQLCETRPGLHVQLGVAALHLATGKEEAEGNA